MPRTRFARFVLLLVVGVAATQLAKAQTYSVIHYFLSPGGAHPNAGVIVDSAGNVYGTTKFGGVSNKGTVFKLDPVGNETVIYSFQGGTDGAAPKAGVIRDADGNLYGTTSAGGAFGHGTVFKIDTDGNESILHSFAAGSDGSEPLAGLVRDSAGNLYGTTYFGGADGKGTVFKIDAAGNETLLVTFSGGVHGTDGAFPRAGLIQDAAGNLYGTTRYGGLRYGTIYRLTPTGGGGLLFSFSGSSGQPLAGLVRDAAGNLYGTTKGSFSKGTVFVLSPSGQLTTLLQFNGFTDAAGGAVPYTGVVRDSAGNLYGTTTQGGDPNCSCGVVFKLDPSGHETVLHAFTGSGDGKKPLGDLFLDSAGNLYGTTSQGGSRNNGIVFKITPQ